MSKFRIVMLSCLGLLLLVGGVAFSLLSNAHERNNVRSQRFLDPSVSPIIGNKIGMRIVLPPSTTILSGCVALSDKTENLIVTHSDKIRGNEHCRFRDVAKNDTLEVVVFTLEGQCFDNKKPPKGSCGNNFSRYMTGVSNGRPLAPIQVGSKVNFSALEVDIVDDKIVVSGNFRGDRNKKVTHKYIIDWNSFHQVLP